MIHLPSPLGTTARTLAAGLGLAACVLGSASAQTVADGPSTTGGNDPVPVASVAPATASESLLDASIAPKDSRGRHMAPHDTFYMLEYVSVKTDKGVEGFAPGQEVHFVSADRAKHTLTVSDGRAQVEVEPSKLTNNMDVVALVRQKDQANQAQVMAYVQAEEAAYKKYEKEAADATAKDLERHSQEQAAQSSVGASTVLNQPTPTADASYNGYGNGYNGYYGNGGYGYGSPYSYFGGYNNNSNNQAAAAAAATAKAPAKAPSVGAPAASGGGKVAGPAPGAGGAVGRPK